MATQDPITDDEQRRRIAAMSVTQRLTLLDQLCRDLTRIAAVAQRVR